MNQPTQGTSKVILDLQSTIDALKTELNITKLSLSETKQKFQILSKRNETLVEQLSNFKHQTEVSESLLKRKERRILDLESQLIELNSSNDNFKFKCDTLTTKFATMESDKLRLISENERLSKSYDTIQSSFIDYKLSMNNTVDNLKFDIPNFINNFSNTMSNNLNLINLNQPEIQSSYNLMVKNSKRLEELYNQKFNKVNNYLLLLAESTKQHGESTSIVMGECEEILKKLNRNEDVLLKIKNQTEGNLTDLDKMKEINKFRDLSILNDSSNIHTNTNSPIHSPKLDSPTPSPLIPNRIVLPSPIQNENKFTNQRKVSPGILDSRFNTDPPAATPPTNRHKKRNSVNIPKRDRRNRNSTYRQSMNQEDFNNMFSNNDDDLDMRKRIASNSSTNSTGESQSISRSNSTRKNYRNSRNFSSGSNNGNGNGNYNGGNRRWSTQPQNNDQ